ncbi:hypothetical protein YC2023_118411 [Brassica napus]
MPIFLSFFDSFRSMGGDGALLDGEGALSRWRRSSLSVATELKRWLSSNRKDICGSTVQDEGTSKQRSQAREQYSNENDELFVKMESRRLVVVVFCHGANRRERVEQVLCFVVLYL